MSKALITLVYRQVINATSDGAFEKNVFHYSFEEFKMKSQAYNLEGKFNTFTELKASDGRANSLHYKTGFAAAGFIETLQKKIPFLQDALGQAILFDTYKFELIESAINNQLLHQVAIHYITSILTLHEIIGDNLLVSYTDKDAVPVETFIIKMQPGLSISNYQQLQHAGNTPPTYKAVNR